MNPISSRHEGVPRDLPLASGMHTTRQKSETTRPDGRFAWPFPVTRRDAALHCHRPEAAAASQGSSRFVT